MKMARRHTQQQIDWSGVESQILAALDIRHEYEALGVRFTDDSPRANNCLECYAVGRQDNSPSAFVSLDTGRYKDSGGDGLSLSLWNFAAQFGDWSTWVEARQHYAAKAGVKLQAAGNGHTQRDPAEHLEFWPWTSSEEILAHLWARHKTGVTVEALKAAGGRIARYRNQYTVVAMPILGVGGVESDPCGWVIWNSAAGQSLPIFHGKETTWRKMKTTGGSESGLLGLHALQRLAVVDSAADTIVWCVEGPTDLLALWAAIPAEQRDSHLVVTNSGGANETPKPWMASVFAGRCVYVVRDADTAGESGGDKWAAFAAASAKECRRVRIPYEVAADHGKDIRDYLSDGHTYVDLLALASAAPVVTAASDGGITQGPQVIEADDDPHRLARVNLERYATNTDGRTLKYWRDEWYVWKDFRYQKISERDFRAKLTESIHDEFMQINAKKVEAYFEKKDRGEIDPDKDKGPPQVQKVSMALVSNTMQATSGMVSVSPSIELGTWLPTRQQESYISMANGLLNIDAVMANEEDCCLQSNSPNWFSMVSLPYEFLPEATCPQWESFLEYNLELDPERIKILQEWAGYLLLPDTGQQKFMVLEGEGANGKSVFISALTAMLGPENVATVPLEKFGDRFSLYTTIGKLLNAAGDCGDLDKAAEGDLKSFTAGDRMLFDRKGLVGITCIPTARLMIACNNRPRFADRSQGVWRRMLLIPWRIEVPQERRVKGMTSVKWWQDSGELPGILRWALIGLARLRTQGGFTKSVLMEEAIKEYQEEVNPARLFLTEHVEADQESVIPSKMLRHFYCLWCEENGYRPLADRSFGKEVKRVFRSADRKQKRNIQERIWVYEGIKFSQSTIAGARVDDYTLF